LTIPVQVLPIDIDDLYHVARCWQGLWVGGRDEGDARKDGRKRGARGAGAGTPQPGRIAGRSCARGIVAAVCTSVQSPESLMIKEFREFIARGNVLDLAVAVIIGAAFGKIVTSLVEGVIMPPLGLALGKIDFSSLFVVLDQSKGVSVSLADAEAKGIPGMAYGAFVNDIVNFVIVAFVIFMIVKQANRLKKPVPAAEAPATRPC